VRGELEGCRDEEEEGEEEEEEEDGDDEKTARFCSVCRLDKFTCCSFLYLALTKKSGCVNNMNFLSRSLALPTS